MNGEINPERQPTAATIDGVLAGALPSIFPHVGLALAGKALELTQVIKDSITYPCISAFGKDREIPYQGSPSRAYQELFALAATNADAKTDLDLQTDLLDFLVDDAKRLEARTASADKEKLGQYLEAFEGLRNRKRKLQGVEKKLRGGARK